MSTVGTGMRHSYSGTHADKTSRFIHFSITAAAVLFIIGLIVWQTYAALPQSMDLRFNPYALLSVASLLSTTVAIVLIWLRIKQRTEVVMWFTGFLLSIAVWAIGEMMWRLSATPEAATFWSPFTTMGSVYMPIMLYMFVLSYTNPQYSLHPLTLPLLIGVSAFFVYLDVHSGLITLYDPAQVLALRPWGYVLPTGSMYGVLTLWIAIFPLAGIILLHRFRRQTYDSVLRKQAGIFILAIFVPLSGGIITDGLFPALGVTSIPMLSVMLLTIVGASISYGMLKYQLFKFTPSMVANEILGTMSEAVLGLHPDLRIGYANSGAEQLLGVPAVRLSGKHLPDFFAEHADALDFQKQLSRILGDGTFGNIDSVELRTAERKHVVAKLSITKLHNRDQPYGYLVVMTDITSIAKAAAIVERKVAERTHELHEEQARLRASIEGLPLGFLLMDDDAHVLIQNESLRHIFGLSHPVDSTRQLDERLVHTNLTKACLAAQETGKFQEVKEAVLGAKILSMYISPVKIAEHGHEKVIGVVVLVQDITEEKVLARSKDEFFSIASHELRTPLTAIKGNASMMLEYYGKIVGQDDSLKEMVIDIHESSTRLIEIVRDFLDVSRVEQDKMIFKMGVVNIAKVIETVAYEMRPIIRDKKLVLKVDTHTLDGIPPVWADRDRVLQIIYNLVSNAAKFTDAGEVTVTTAIEGRHIRLRVADTGRGIPLKNQRLLFHKFQQAGDSLLTRDTTRGTGLGLYISRLMAQKMGCTLGLEGSVEGRGSIFYLTVPIATKAQLAGTAPVERPGVQIDPATGLSTVSDL